MEKIIEKRILAAVESGELSSKEALKKFDTLKENLFNFERRRESLKITLESLKKKRKG